MTLTYLMQIYSQLQRRNAFALKLHLATCETGDAAVFVAGLAPGGGWSHGTSVLWELAADIAATKEAHHFYPVLFYMRFPQPYYSMSSATLVLLDTVTIMRAALGHQYAAVKNLGALDQIWHGSLLLLTSLEETFLPEGAAGSQEPDSAEAALWERRLDRAMVLLRAAGLCTLERSDACTRYQELRTQWHGHLQMACAFHALFHAGHRSGTLQSSRYDATHMWEALAAIGHIERYWAIRAGRSGSIGIS